MVNKNKLFIPALTGYRAIAAWIIFIYHFFPFNNAIIPSVIKNVVAEFHFGVDLFFVLSGFLITYRYYNQAKINFKQYMVNRFARIYPMYFLLTILVFFVAFVKTNTWSVEQTKEFILSITMTKAFFSQYFLVGIPQGWTLTLEEMFYFTAPIYFLLIKKNMKWVYILPILIFLVGILLKNITNFPSNVVGFLQTGIHVFIFEFFAGISLALFVLNKKIEFKYNWVTYFAIGVILVYILGKSYLSYYINLKSEIGRALEVIFLSYLGVAPLLWGLIHEKTIIQKFLGSKYMVILGKSSYIFYLIHKGFIPNFINDYIIDNKLILFIILNLLSILMFYTLEEPINNYIRRKYKTKRP